MEGFVAHKLNEYTAGKVSRRGLIDALTLAASTAYVGTAKAAESPALKVALINHLSYTCPRAFFDQVDDILSLPEMRHIRLVK